MLVGAVTAKHNDDHSSTVQLHVYTYTHVCCIGVRPPQQRLLVTNSGSHLYDSEIVKSYTAISPVSVNTLWRMMYWYNSTLNSVMSQSLDGKDIIVSSHAFVYILYVTVYAEIGHLSAKFILRYKPKRLKRTVGEYPLF